MANEARKSFGMYYDDRIQKKAGILKNSSKIQFQLARLSLFIVRRIHIAADHQRR